MRETDTASWLDASLMMSHLLVFFDLYLDPDCGLIWVAPGSGNCKMTSFSAIKETFCVCVYRLNSLKLEWAALGVWALHGCRCRNRRDGQLLGRLTGNWVGGQTRWPIKFLSLPMHTLFWFILKFILSFCFLGFGSATIPGSLGAVECCCVCGVEMGVQNHQLSSFLKVTLPLPPSSPLFHVWCQQSGHQALV